MARAGYTGGPELNWLESTSGTMSWPIPSLSRVSAVLYMPDMTRCSWIICHSCLSLYLILVLATHARPVQQVQGDV